MEQNCSGAKVFMIRAVTTQLQKGVSLSIIDTFQKPCVQRFLVFFAHFCG